MQLIHLGNICKKDGVVIVKPSDDLEEMVKKRFVDEIGWTIW